MSATGGGSVTDDFPRTVTLARVMAAQGDLASAREVLRSILDAAPEDGAARSFLDEIAARVETVRGPETPEEPLADPVPGDPAALEALRQALGRARPSDPASRLGTLLRRIEEHRRRELTR